MQRVKKGMEKKKELSQEKIEKLLGEYIKIEAELHAMGIIPVKAIATKAGVKKMLETEYMAELPLEVWEDEIEKLHKLKRGIAIKRIRDNHNGEVQSEG